VISTPRPFSSAAEQLLLALTRVDLLIERHVERLRAARALTDDEFRGLYIPESYVDALLLRRDVDAKGTDRDEADWTSRLRGHDEEMRTRVDASLAAGVTLPLEKLRIALELSPFEIEALVIAVAPELDSRYERLYAYAQNDVTKKRPAVDLVLKLLCAGLDERVAAQGALAARAPLVGEQLVRLVADPHELEPTFLSHFLAVDRRIVDLLLGKNDTDQRLMAFTRRCRTAPRRLDDLGLPSDLEDSLRRFAAVDGAVVFAMLGADRTLKEAAAAAVCAMCDQELLVVDVPRLLNETGRIAETARLLRREAVLRDAAIYLDHFDVSVADDLSVPGKLSELEHGLAGASTRVFLDGAALVQPSAPWSDSSVLAFDFPLPDFARRVDLWKEALAEDAALAREVDVTTLAGRFALGAGQIRGAARQARLRAGTRVDATLATRDVAAAAREQSTANLSRLAKKIEPIHRWSDIVLPPRPMEQLREVLASARYRHLVYGTWGFDAKLSLGKGLNVLFSGPSGTGKTMAAEILANELSLDLYKIDLSTVVSKYIGETEKGLSSIFREAETSNAILFFDEADALFGKRSDVKDAHDRYANIEVAYLLQRMDEYEGTVILATNLSENLDPAFARRMHHIVEFPLPDAAHRERIWCGVFPREAPLAEDVDLAFLARQFELTGGNIRNVALAAAFRAADEGAPIRMAHLIVATGRELEKTGKLPSRADFRHYYELIAERDHAGATT